MIKKMGSRNLQEPEIALTKQVLERVAKRELHFTRRTSRAGDCSEGGSRNTNSRKCKAVVIEQIEGLPSDLKGVTLRPRHLESLQESCVKVPETRSTEDISISNLSVMREPNSARSWIGWIEHRCRIIKELNRSVRCIVNVALKARGIAVVVCRRAVEVKAHRESSCSGAEWKPTASSEDSADFPTANYLIQPTG
jgi:hypothetical protein